MDELHDIQHPHDALFRGVFGDPERAGELLRSALPDDVVAAIDWRTLRREEGSFVDEGDPRRTRDRLSASLLHCSRQQRSRQSACASPSLTSNPRWKPST